MRRLSKFFAAFGIVVLISILFDMKVSSAATEEQFLAPPTEEALPEDVNEVIKINPANTLANNYFKVGRVTIKSSGNNIVTVTGVTEAYSKVRSITVNLYLQRWDATRGTWVTIVNIGGFTNNNATSVRADKKVQVSSNYYYRARAHHRTSHNGTIEQGWNHTSSIYLD